MFAYFIDWADLSAIALTYQEAIDYVNRTAEKENIKIEWCDPDVSTCFYSIYPNGIKEAYEIYELIRV